MDDHTDRRLEDLEVKLAFMDDLLDRLNDLVARQQGQIDQLAAELRRQQVQLDGAAAGGPGAPRDERPPHW
jgi:SlyX protein